jgi:two-component system heavy metal sensor histidine kinase CusS
MKSLRVQLLVGTALGMAAVLLMSGAVLYALIGSTLRSEFDASLVARARSLMALAEQDEEGMEFELTEVSLPEFEPSERAEYYQLWLSDGTVFARSPSLLKGALDQFGGTSDTPAFRTVRLPDGRPGRLVGVTFVPRQEYEDSRANPAMTVTLVLGRDIVGLRATLARVRGILIGVCLVAVVLSAGVLAWVVRWRLQPVDHLSRQIAEVREDDLSARVSVAGIPNELSPVVDRLNDLLARLDAAFQRERRFTGDVAHELRTPLAGLRSKLELTLSRDRDGESYQETLRDCLEIDLQMQRMVENLLHLARADAGQLEIRHERADLAEVIRECWKPLEEKANARGLSVEWQLDERDTLITDRGKLRLVIQNVLDNAVTYANDQGQLSVATAAQDNATVVTVSNTGSSLPSEDIDRVFERFWRADPSYQDTDEESRCGLGLPLCKAVTEQLGGSICATADDSGMFTITIRLPHV